MMKILIFTLKTNNEIGNDDKKRDEITWSQERDEQSKKRIDSAN